LRERTFACVDVALIGVRVKSYLQITKASHEKQQLA